MKKFFLIYLYISSLFSYDVLVVKAKILSKIAHELVKKDIVNIYVEDKDLARTKGLLSSLKYTSFDKADVVFIANSKHVFKNKKYIFSTSYYTYKNNLDLLGAFFWQKGRPNIIIRKKVAKEKGLSFSADFKKFLE